MGRPSPSICARPSTAAASSSTRREPFEFWIDQGGTFTDLIARLPDGSLRTAKVLSGEGSVLRGIRSVLEGEGAIAKGTPLPPSSVKLGTTLATNALLERRGARVLLVTNAGLGDVFVIGTQERPELFALHIEKPSPLHERTLEVRGRVAADGDVVSPLDESAARAALSAARREGVDSVAIATLHGHAFPEHEARLEALAVEAGFAHVAVSHRVDRELGFLARGETTIADAYLTPVLRRHVDALASELPGSRLRFMQSSGGLTDGPRFRGPAALLSGPAGGGVAAGRIARGAGFDQAVGFDMGGTSTDVCLLEDGEVERSFETTLGGIHVRAPVLRIHTVAAGGGSLCRFDGFRLTVGPESAGAEPGPLCYARRGPDGRLLARELTLTDANLFLGRLPGDRFPFPLAREPVERVLAELETRLRGAGFPSAREEIAAGFLEVGNAGMAEAIRQVSVVRGVDPRGCALVGFGGAAGQHLCAVARRLGIRTLLVHPLAGLLSAYGIGIADVAWDGQQDCGRAGLTPGAPLPAAVQEILRELEAEGRAALDAAGEQEDAAIVAERRLDLRYVGTESALAVGEPPEGDWASAFAREREARFGYARPGRAIEIMAARVSVRRPGRVPHGLRSFRDGASADLAPLRQERVYFTGEGWLEAPVFEREQLAPGASLAGPALVLDASSTLVLDPGFSLRVAEDGLLVLEDGAPLQARALTSAATPDPVSLEVFGNRFMSIAEQMGAVLRNTAVSTNIKERLDYSCAVFDPHGGLVANAPHIPVHLGAMGETVRAVQEEIPDLAPGDVAVTNDPFRGGSHLPDVTVVTPVFVAGASRPSFFVATRGHQADVGGKTPGSMPADSSSLEEEGVLLRAFRLVHAGRLDEARVRAELGRGPHPARSPDDNVADLEAMLAANRKGEALLAELASEQGLDTVLRHMQALQEAAGAKVSHELARFEDGTRAFADALDDGTPIVVRLELRKGRVRIDFGGTGAAVPGNLNAPPAVVRAAVLYVLRCLVAERIPLNGGCMAPVELVVPPGSLLDPPPGSAVVGGNVETSQRVVDVLLGALDLAAASQGTLNNVAFGNERFGHYETLGGGAGAGPGFDGTSAVHVHMTNTRITDPEVLELRYPVRLVRFAIRHGSGGTGRWRGGDGLVREYEFLAPVTVSLLTERRVLAPFGLAGGGPGAKGRNGLQRRDGTRETLAGHATAALHAGDRLIIETPGGGGFGTAVGASRQP